MYRVDRKALIGILVITVAIGASMALTFQTFDAALNTQINNPKIGLVVNSPTSISDVEQISNIYAQAASTHAGRSNVYVFWDIIEPHKGEYDWRQSDILMSLNKNNNLKVTLYFSLINGKTLGPFPDWIGNPNLISVNPAQVASTLDAILTRYHIIDSVIIAGEADEHFRYNEQNIPVYRELFEQIYGELKSKHPDVQFGNAYSLHGVINKDLRHIVADLDVGDFVGFTYFPVDSLNEISKTPDEAAKDLEYALDLAGDKNVGFFEVGWSTSDFVNGGEADQQKFISNSFDFYNEYSQEIEFFTWYRQYDRPEGTCAVSTDAHDSKISITGGSGLGGNEHVVERLSRFVCNAGLIDSEGNPKPGWDEFTRQIMQSY